MRQQMKRHLLQTNALTLREKLHQVEDDETRQYLHFKLRAIQRRLDASVSASSQRTLG